MRHRTDTINRFPATELSVHIRLVEGVIRYTGHINGKFCVSAATREAAVHALMRRAAEASVH